MSLALDSKSLLYATNHALGQPVEQSAIETSRNPRSGPLDKGRLGQRRRVGCAHLGWARPRRPIRRTLVVHRRGGRFPAAPGEFLRVVRRERNLMKSE